MNNFNKMKNFSLFHLVEEKRERSVGRAELSKSSIASRYQIAIKIIKCEVEKEEEESLEGS